MREILFRKDQAEDKGAVMEVKDYPPYLDYPKSRRPQANGDRIRAMSDGELAEFVCRNSINTMCDIICGGWCNAVATLKKSGDEMCKEIVIKWLQQPAEGGENNDA